MSPQVYLPPRVYAEDGEPALLTDALEILIEDETSNWHGKSAIRHLALIGDLLPEHMEFLSDWFKSNYSMTVRAEGDLREFGEGSVVIHSTPQRGMPSFELAGWGIFEFIDFLRLKGFDYENVMKVVVKLDTHFAAGSPRIWAPVLEYLARRVDSKNEQADHLTVFDLLSELITNELDNDLHVLNSFLDSLVSAGSVVPRPTPVTKLPERVESIFYCDDALLPFLAKRIAERLRLGDSGVIDTWILAETDRWLKGHLLGDEEAKECILKAYQRERNNVAAHWSMLLLCDPQWHPESADGMHAIGGNLPNANWKKLTAKSAVLTRTNLETANLENSTFQSCNFNGVDFTSANLSATSMTECNTRGSSLRFATLSQANIDSCLFIETQLQDSVFSEAMIRETQFPRCNFTGADLNSLIAKSCDFRGALLKQARFDGVRLDQCRLDNLDLRTTEFEGAVLRHCSLTKTNLEDIRLDGEFSDCNFAESLMTGSMASGTVFRDCNFYQAGLADIEWVNCDLRGAKFLASAFHLGSSRCGTLDSPYPSHGTRTGYYTDDYEDLHFKSPESIRKAALVDCDLRGAVLNQTDFYLVDLRGSKFDRVYESHLRSCGAILDD